MVPTAPFRGWPPATLAWFAGIERHNDREWFQANRDVYEQAVRQPFLSLLAEVADEFGDGKLFLVSKDGKVSVVKAKPQWELLSSSDLGETTRATPAIAEGRVYIRTEKTIYCFGG